MTAPTPDRQGFVPAPEAMWQGPGRAPYASRPDESRGRLYPEGPSRYRTAFQRDRDRIVHSSAFRRLKHKTQVFIEHEGDYYRTRLTHSIEVAQVARTIAGVLGLDTDLTEAVALAHDLGHPPFGHTGEEALATLMAPHGGFDHNAQAIRIVTRLERHYAAFDGLNLTWEVLEGIAKHNGPVPRPAPYALEAYADLHDLELATHASAEAQVAALADDVAYNSHDLHDGLRAGLFDEAELAAMPMLDAAFGRVDARWPGIGRERRRHEALRRFFGTLVEDVIAQAQGRLAELAPADAQAVRDAGRSIVRFSEPVWQDLRTIRTFLYHRMYRAPSVVEMRAHVTAMIDDLFPLYMSRPDLLPDAWQGDVAVARGDAALARLVVDYIAGMTDRFAIQEHGRLTGEDARHGHG